MGDLTANFSRAEYERASARSGGWPAGRETELRQLAQLAQTFRDALGVPGIITSAYRSAPYNASIGGSSNSQHIDAEAQDIVFFGATDRDVATVALQLRAQRGRNAFGQVIVYDDTGHAHLSLATLGVRNGEILRAYRKDGARRYLPVEKPEDVPGLSGRELRPLDPERCPTCGARLYHPPE